MHRQIIACLSALLMSPALFAQKASLTKYTIDPEHTSVGFEVPHLVISAVEGHFGKFSGQFNFDEKSVLAGKGEGLQIEAQVDADSIDTGNSKRDNHLRSPDFFNSKKYPKLSFKSTAVEANDPKHWKLKGQLTIRDKTLPVVFDLDYKGTAVAYEKQRVAFKAVTHIDRKAFGLTWNDIVEAGPVVGDDITITLVVQGIRASDL
jgi:polyisoprenoid-binding protein YceI